MDLIWHDVPLKSVNLLTLKKTKVYDFFNCVDEINALLRQYPRVEFDLYQGNHTGLHLKKSYYNCDLYGSQVLATDCKTVLSIIIHDEQKGWCFIETERDKQSTTSNVSGTKSLRELIVNCPEIKDWISDDIKANTKWREHSRQYYNAEKGFQGIPSSAQQYNNKRIHHVWSLDVNSAFPAALTEIVPSTRPYINNLFMQRKTNKYYKQILNNCIGAMCSNITKHLGYAPGCLSELRDKVLERHNNFMNNLIADLESQGAIILNKRIDSVKFIWTKPYAPLIKGVGTNLGELKYEFRDCDYLQVSTSKYQYIDENGNLQVVISGLTSLDYTKPNRSAWDWEDIFDCGDQIAYTFDDEEYQFRRMY